MSIESKLANNEGVKKQGILKKIGLAIGFTAALGAATLPTESCAPGGEDKTYEENMKWNRNLSGAQEIERSLQASVDEKQKEEIKGSLRFASDNIAYNFPWGSYTYNPDINEVEDRDRNKLEHIAFTFVARYAPERLGGIYYKYVKKDKEGVYLKFAKENPVAETARRMALEWEYHKKTAKTKEIRESMEREDMEGSFFSYVIYVHNGQMTIQNVMDRMYNPEDFSKD